MEVISSIEVESEVAFLEREGRRLLHSLRINACFNLATSIIRGDMVAGESHRGCGPNFPIALDLQKPLHGHLSQ